MFHCANDAFHQVKSKQWEKLLMDITEGTAQGFRQVFHMGLQTTTGTEAPIA